ncbi:GAS2-like protein pickled eggs isoform X2 [Frankliniella occidentalis]|uniref:GAS2-like protein pickled eggs isoform X2 n=1 Tax=Frankliniella occidentalis TaxID=133901 RepID=A0A9C6X062_FRAOC|nr:GAS2-like protein pickled eggs isoform X2 [Frankliniella occidentalis]
MALLEARPYRPFKSSEEYLYAMKEDLAEWLNALYPGLDLGVDNFLDRLETGVLLCKHANAVRQSALDYVSRRQARGRPLTASASTSGGGLALALALSLRGEVRYLAAAKPGTFFARDNVSNFIAWCRKDLGVIECLLFETEDLIARKNEKHVILCLLEVARRGAKMGMLAPMLVQLEREIDREIALEARAQQRTDLVQEEGMEDSDEDDDDDDDDMDNRFLGPMPQIITNDLKSLDEMVRELVERCQCPTQFPMIRVSEGKYRIGDTKVLIFVRVLRSHVMVRVGGGWDTLSHYLDKHDPCRCRSSHRAPVSAKLVLKNQGSLELNSAHVHYERSPPRTRRSSASSVSSGGRPDMGCLPVPTVAGYPGSPSSTLQQATRSPRNRSRSPTPGRRGQSTGAAKVNGVAPCGPGLSPTLAASTASSRARSRSPADPNPNVYSHVNGSALGVPGEPSRSRSRSPTPRRSSAVSTVSTNGNLGVPAAQRARPRDRSASPNSLASPVLPRRGSTRIHKSATTSAIVEPVDDADFPRAHRLVRPRSPSPGHAWSARAEPVMEVGRIVDVVPADAAPQPSPAQLVQPAVTTTTVVVTSGGDSGSEVGSDEGYRSLGVATTPPAGEKRSIIAGVRDNEAGDIHEEPSTRESSCSDLSASGDVLNANIPAPGTPRSVRRNQTGIPAPTSRPGSRPSSRPGSRPASRPSSRPGSRATSRDRGDYDIEEAIGQPRRMAELGGTTCGGFYAKAAPGPGGRRRSSGSEDLEAVAGGLRRLQAAREASVPTTAPSAQPARSGRSRSASADHTQQAGAHRINGLSHQQLAGQQLAPQRRSSSSAGAGSWGAGRKPRPSLTPDTFTRGTPQRASLPARGRASRPQSRQSNGNVLPQTNNISPILEQILKGSDLQDDAKVLQKMKDIIQHYAAIVDEKLAREEEEEQLDFTSAWVRGLPSQQQQQLQQQGQQARVTPRKDVHPQGTTSRIPAPVAAGKHRV